MKNYIKILIIGLLLAACSETEPVLFNGQTGVRFVTATSQFTVPAEGITITTEIISTTLSTSERTFSVSVDSTNVTAADYSIGTAVIPANSYTGTLDVTFNYDGLEDFVTNLLIVSLDVPDGSFALSPNTFAFSFVKEFDPSTVVCTDLKLVIEHDSFGSETTFEITDASGAVVQSGGPFSDVSGGETNTFTFSLPGNACYTFTIFDSFGDGLFDGNVTGTYNLTCAAISAVSYASGEGDFGDSETTDFCLN